MDLLKLADRIEEGERRKGLSFDLPYYNEAIAKVFEWHINPSSGEGGERVLSCSPPDAWGGGSWGHPLPNYLGSFDEVKTLHDRVHPGTEIEIHYGDHKRVLITGVDDWCRGPTIQSAWIVAILRLENKKRSSVDE